MQQIKNILILLLICGTAECQTLSPKVIASDGGYSSSPGASLSWTLGEANTKTLQNGSVLLTQGFQQPELDILTGTINTALCAGENISVPFIAEGYYGAANIFTVQLSNSSGSFASPVNIGSASGTTSGTVEAMIPANTVFGIGYKARIISNLPNYIGKDNGINITINQPSTSIINASVCQGSTYSFGSKSLSVTGTYLDTMLNKAGCDSIITLNLSLKSRSTNTINASICQGSSYSFGGKSLSITGTYLDTVLNKAGCDSIISLNLSLKSRSTNIINASICQGSSYSFGGKSLSITGTYLDTLLNKAGCDSIITLNLSLKSRSTNTINASICQGSSYSFGGKSLSITGTYLDTLLNKAGCDSIITLNLTVNPLPTVTVNPISICKGTGSTISATGTSTTYTWAPSTGLSTTSGASVTANPATTTTYTITGTNSCGTTSTTAVVTVTSLPTVNVNSISICNGTGGTLTASGASTYTWTPSAGLSATTGASVTANPTITTTYTVTGISTCGSTTGTSVVTVNPVLAPAVNISANPSGVICSGTSVTFTATPNNGGNTPSYQWKKNGNNVGSNSATYTDNGLINNNVITCVLTSDAVCTSPTTATSTGITMTVNATVTPSVNISANPSGAICSGTSVTFTAAPNNGGNTPSYQWKKNGNNVGSNSATYTDNGLINNNVITCVLTSDAVCTSPTTATSTGITMTVNATVTPSVNISANPSGVICSGTSVTFTAAPNNGGNTPSYQWKKNGNNVGSNSATYTDNGLINNDVITCVLTSDAICASPTTATSTGITMTVNATVTPSVNISANPSGAICSGTSVTFTATPNNGGNTPSYQWKKNGNNVGSNSATYTDNGLINNDVITCVLTSDAICASPTTATSTGIIMTVNATVTPSVNISANPSGAICSGTSVTFTATPNNGGNTPSYQWKKNGTNVGSNSATYTDNGLINNDVITCVLTSDAICTSSSTATSKSITETVNPLPTVTVNPISICKGTGSTISATGTSTTYTWAPSTGLSTTSGASVTANPATTTTYTITGTNSCGTTSTTAVVTVTSLPTVNVNSISICNGTGGTLTASGASTYTWTPSAGLSATTGASVTANPTITTTYTVTGISTCGSTTGTSVVTVNPVLAPAVNISANPSGVICSGTSVTFTATPNNGGNTPSYQWKKNGNNVGSNSATYTDNGLINNDVITCVLTSDAICASPTTATSTGITMTVNATVTPSVNISANPSGVICSGTSVTFTAAPNNGGNTPSYQWKKNGNNVGSNSATYTDNGLINNDVITCVLTSDAICASPTTATSTGITMTVNATVTPSVNISANPSGAICSGTSVTFTATPNNGGNTPSYQWKKNGNNVGSNSATYTDNGLINNDVITCVLTSDAICASPTTATSTGITMTVNATVTPSVNISANPSGAICSGTSVTFTATPNNGGNTPSYQWKKNGNDVGTNLISYTNDSLVNNDIINCTMSSSATCVSPQEATSSGITVIVNPLPDASIIINGSSKICDGDSVQLSAPVGNPIYVWNPGNEITKSIYAKYTGNYFVKVTSINNCSTTSSPVLITVNPLPSPPIITQFNADSLISTPAVTYQWYFDSNVIKGATNQKLGDIQDGNYQVEISDTNGCMNKSVVFPVINTSVRNMLSDIALSIYPNPNGGTFTMKADFGESLDVNISLTNMLGEKMMIINRLTSVGKYSKDVDITNFPAGVYFLRVETNNASICRRVVKLN